MFLLEKVTRELLPKNFYFVLFIGNLFSTLLSKELGWEMGRKEMLNVLVRVVVSLCGGEKRSQS